MLFENIKLLFFPFTNEHFNNFSESAEDRVFFRITEDGGIKVQAIYISLHFSFKMQHCLTLHELQKPADFSRSRYRLYPLFTGFDFYKVMLPQNLKKRSVLELPGGNPGQAYVGYIADVIKNRIIIKQSYSFHINAS